MSNTTVTVTYANGDTREFVASDKLETLINKGEMFGITTLHPEHGDEFKLSKMYIGNPMAALGNMIIMKRNAESFDDTQGNIVVDVLSACITLLIDEITSHQSELSTVDKLPMAPHCYYSNNVCPHRNKSCIGDTSCDDYLPIDGTVHNGCGHFHINKHICLAESNLDNKCIGHSDCKDFVPF